MLRSLVTLALLAFGLMSARVSAQSAHPVLVMSANSFNKPVEPYTISEITATFAPGSSLSTFFAGFSSGQVPGFAATVRPWATRTAAEIPVIDYAACGGGPNNISSTTPRDYYLLQQTGVGAAVNGGVNVNAFPLHFFIEPDFACSTVGMHKNGAVTIFGRYPYSVWAHELLHYYGLAEALVEECSPAGCRWIYSGNDNWNVMGNAWTWEYPGMFERLFLNYRTKTLWVDPARLPIVTTDGVYTVQRVEAQTGIIGLRMSVVADEFGNSDELGIEVRKDGVVMRKAFNQGGFYRVMGLVDVDTASSNFWAVLAPGQAFPWKGRTVTVETFGAGLATVRVSGFGSTPQPPIAATDLRAQ